MADRCTLADSLLSYFLRTQMDTDTDFAAAFEPIILKSKVYSVYFPAGYAHISKNIFFRERVKGLLNVCVCLHHKYIILSTVLYPHFISFYITVKCYYLAKWEFYGHTANNYAGRGKEEGREKKSLSYLNYFRNKSQRRTKSRK